MTHSYLYNKSQTQKGEVNPSILSKDIQKTSITIAVDGINYSDSSGALEVVFKIPISPEEKTILDGVIFNHDGTSAKGIEAPTTSDKKPRVQIDPREGSSYNSPSINWCDKTTWFATSNREEDIVMDLVADTSGLTWETPNDTVWVDVCHGKITGERNFRETYRPIIKVNGEAKAEKTAENLVGDYTVDYRNGKISFEVAPGESALVEASFSKVNDSSWTIVPAEGKRLDIVAVEVQFSSDVELTDTIIFSVWGVVDYFAPHLVSTTPNYQSSFPTGFKIPLKKYFYQTMDDFVNDSQRSYAKIPKLGGDGWRGMKTDQFIFRWPYYEESVRRLHSYSGMELRVQLENNIELIGNKTISTFYGISEAE